MDDLRDLKLKIYRRCPQCNASGMEYNPVLLHFWAEWEKYSSLHSDADLKQFWGQWIRDNGFAPNNIPPAYVVCSMCTGDGLVEEMISLSALRLMLLRKTAEPAQGETQTESEEQEDASNEPIN